MLQNIYYFVGAANSTAPQDSLQSQIIALLPCLTTLRIHVTLFAYPAAMYDQTVAALASLKHIEDISFTFTMDSRLTTYSTYPTQVLRIFASSIRALGIIGGEPSWFIGDGFFSEFRPFLDGNRNISRPWSFPRLRYLELRNVRGEANIYAQIPFDTPLVTLALSFNTLFLSPLPRRRVQRLVLWVSMTQMPPSPHFEPGPSADILDLRVPIGSTMDFPLVTGFSRVVQYVSSLLGETSRKVTWKVECSIPKFHTKVKEELQEPSVIAIFDHLAAACHKQQLVWEMEGP